ncbi:MAG: M48 family metallopeptidase [Nitrospina sp.]|jgi:predicted Zn-dependent protease|nr:M48 family metallopeptidase [Nitrospina sp.]MBT5550743.1 M48 family metallopeptidase [Nitrospina sp.]
MTKKFFLIFIVAILVGCQTTQKTDCAGCAYDLYLWKTAVGTVARANFPDEEYNAVVHYADFSNAWVTSGNDINITDDLLHQLSAEQRMAVAAHEMGHLKAGHYYSTMGVSILTSIAFTVAGAFVPGLGYAEYAVKPLVVGGFSRPQELEADKLGVGYLQKAGLPPQHFIEVFEIFREESGGKSDEASYFSTHPTTRERIQQIQDFYTKPEPARD